MNLKDAFLLICQPAVAGDNKKKSKSRVSPKQLQESKRFIIHALLDKNTVDDIIKGFLEQIETSQSLTAHEDMFKAVMAVFCDLMSSKNEVQMSKGQDLILGIISRSPKAKFVVGRELLSVIIRNFHDESLTLKKKSCEIILNILQGSKENKAFLILGETLITILANELLSCGDWDLQSMIVEVIYRVCPRSGDNRISLMKVIFGKFEGVDDLVDRFLHIQGTTFYEGVRIFLNDVNNRHAIKSSDYHPRSFKCISVVYHGHHGNQTEMKPFPPSESGLWLDFNRTTISAMFMSINGDPTLVEIPYGSGIIGWSVDPTLDSTKIKIKIALRNHIDCIDNVSEKEKWPGPFWLICELKTEKGSKGIESLTHLFQSHKAQRRKCSTAVHSIQLPPLKNTCPEVLDTMEECSPREYEKALSQKRQIENHQMLSQTENQMIEGGHSPEGMDLADEADESASHHCSSDSSYHPPEPKRKRLRNSKASKTKGKCPMEEQEIVPKSSSSSEDDMDLLVDGHIKQDAKVETKPMDNNVAEMKLSQAVVSGSQLVKDILRKATDDIQKLRGPLRDTTCLSNKKFIQFDQQEMAAPSKQYRKTPFPESKRAHQNLVGQTSPSVKKATLDFGLNTAMPASAPPDFLVSPIMRASEFVAPSKLITMKENELQRNYSTPSKIVHDFGFQDLDFLGNDSDSTSASPSPTNLEMSFSEFGKIYVYHQKSIIDSLENDISSEFAFLKKQVMTKLESDSRTRFNLYESCCKKLARMDSECGRESKLTLQNVYQLTQRVVQN